MNMKKVLFLTALFLMIAVSAFAAQEINLTADSVYSDLGITGDAVINGNGHKLTFTANFVMKGDLKISNVVHSGAHTIYAAGHTLEFTNDVTWESLDMPLTIYGGGASSSTCESTDVRLYGGLFSAVYGGSYRGTVTGDTNVIIGGNVCKGLTPNNEADAAVKCPLTVRGGGNNGTVGGSTHVTLQDNAVATFIYGAGNSENDIKETNVYIKGGKTMNVLGGSGALTNCNTNIVMTGGIAEALFGGSSGATMTGNTKVVVKGGEVTRRIFGGCYNNCSAGLFKFTWSTSHYVSGTTTVILYPGANLISGNTYLSGDNNDLGIRGGSRMGSSNSAEKSVIMFMDGRASSNVPTKASWPLTSCGSYHNYLITASAGGTVERTSTEGTFLIKPDWGKYGSIGSNYYINENASVSSGTTNVTFADNFAISSLSANATSSGADVTVGFVAKNVKSRPQPKLLVSIFDSNKNFVGAGVTEPASSATSNTFNVKAELENGKTYTVKAMLWDGNLEAQTNVKETTFSK